MSNRPVASGHRQGESGIVPDRRSRLYCRDGEWYFRAREAPDQGPFSSYVKAKESLRLFLRRSGIVKIAI